MSRRVRGAAAAVTLVLLVALAGCGGGGGSAERPTRSASPSRTLPSQTRSPGTTNGPTGEPSASKTVAPSPTAAPTRPKASRSPTQAPPTSQAPPTLDQAPPTTGATPDDAGGPDADDGAPDVEAQPISGAGELSAGTGGDDVGDPERRGVAVARRGVRRGGPGRERRGRPVLGLVAARRPSGGRCAWSWWGWCVHGAAAGGVSASRRPRQRSRWLARELLPQLRDTGSLERVAGGWQVGLPRVTALEDELTVLESSTKKVEDAARARTLRDAVRSAHARVDSLVAGGGQDIWALDLDEVVALLESALSPGPQAE